jgi:hypothetical protein
LAGIGTRNGMGSRDSIAAHAQKLLKDAVDTGKILPDANAATSEAVVPSFSQGTVALDPNTGRPTVDHKPEPSVLDTTGTVPLPDADDTEAGAAAEAAAAGKSVAAPASADRERDERGKFTPAPDTAPKPKKAPKTQEQRATAAEDAAQEILDEWADAAELEFEHDDGSKYKIRTPKASAKQVERFNQRQAIVNRKAAFLDKARPALEPLIASGQLDAVLPLLQRALTDKDFSDFVTQAYNRRMIGQPLMPQTVVDNPSPAQTRTQSPQIAASATMPEISDPYIQEAVGPILQQQMAEIARLREAQQNWEQQQQTAAQQQAQERARQEQQRAQVGAAHQDLVRMYPAVFTGDLSRDQREFDNVIRYARDSNYANTYGIRAGIILAAQHLQAERADSASPAAEMINNLDRATLRAANAQAASARSVTGGSAAAPRPAPKAPPAKPSPRDQTGRLKKPADYMRESQEYVAALAAG